MFSFLSQNKTQDEKHNNFLENDYEFDMLLLKIRQICGIDLEVKRSTIKSKLIKFCVNNNILSFKDLGSKLDFNNSLKQELFDYITVCETYFYRELKQLNELIFLLRTNPGKRRILCAPCSSGEEVYSILMLANEASINNLEIVGIDINQEIINKAKEKFYSKRSLYNLDNTLISKYFTPKDDGYVFSSNIDKNARFEIVNVFDKKLFDLGRFDVILSRNMMIYFNEEYKYKLIDNFTKMLNPNGLFFAGHADLVPQHDGLEKIYAHTCTYYIKK